MIIWNDGKLGSISAAPLFRNPQTLTVPLYAGHSIKALASAKNAAQPTSDDAAAPSFLGTAVYNNLEGQGDLVSRLILVMLRVTIWVLGVINYLLTKSP